MNYIIAIFGIISAFFVQPEQVTLKTHTSATYEVTLPEYLSPVEIKNKELFIFSDVNGNQYQRGLVRGYEYKGMGKGLVVDELFCRSHFEDFSTVFYKTGGLTITLESLEVNGSQCVFKLQTEEKVDEGFSGKAFRIQTVSLYQDSEYFVEAVYSQKEDAQIFSDIIASVKLFK